MDKKNPKRTGKFRVQIHFNGLGGHSSTPYKTHNPLTAGTELIHVITGRLWYEFTTFQNATIFPVSFDAGTKANIIPETADLTLYGEYSAEDEYQKLQEIVLSSLEFIRGLYHVDFELNYENL